MSRDPGYHNRQITIVSKISSLFYSLDSSNYDEVAPKVEFWVEYALAEHSTTIDELVKGVSPVAWGSHTSFASVARFLKEFRDASNRSDQAKSFVDELCPHILRWFAAASTENLSVDPGNNSVVAKCGGDGFIRAASCVGYLIEWSLLSSELVRRHLVKPLIAHHYRDRDDAYRSVRTMAIFELFAAARNSLLQGLLDPDDVQACFKMLDIKITTKGMVGPNAGKLNELREFHATWLKQEEEERRDCAGIQDPKGGEKCTKDAGVPAEVGNLVTFVPQTLSAPTIDINLPSSIFQGVGSPPDTCDNSRATVVSPALSFSTMSDLTSTELGEIERSGEQAITPHDTFYFEDGNVEIVCGDTIFRVHSTIISFSSSKLRDILSPSMLLNAPMPEGHPRVTVSDSAEDFAVLLKMIYTPGFPARNKVPEFALFTSLLRMTTKYDFSVAREGLVEDLRSAYPTKWEEFEAAKVLGENIFGSPKPHPNAVFNLFLEQRIKFALPFASYRAGLGGPSSLASDKPGTVLSRLTLANIIHGIGEIRRMMVHAAHGIAYVGNLSACPQRVCILNVPISSSERRAEALRKISDVVAKKSEGDMLSSLSLGNLLCADCARLLQSGHRDCRKQLVWARLPSLLGWESWEGIS